VTGLGGVRRVVVEADGGSRGNPGPAAYGAVLKEAETGEVLAEDGTPIGIATNNVAEYSGLIAGLRMAADLVPEAEVEVRMDSKLVVEQMSGRWQVKHPDMRPLHAQARALAPAGTTYSWVPRALNKHADRLANEAMDGVRSGVTVLIDPAAEPADSLVAEVESPTVESPSRGWSRPVGPPTTLVLLRHGVTPHTLEKRFSGGLASSNPPLSEDGREQARLSAAWLRPMADRIDAIVTSPVLRTRQTAEIAAEVLGRPVGEIATEPGFAEMEFGAWDGLTYAEVEQRFPGQLATWLDSLDNAPAGGESFRTVEARVLAALDRVVAEHHGRTVLVVSHVTPIKTLVARAVGADLGAVFRMELAPASVSVVSFYDDGDDGTQRGSLRFYNGLPAERDPFAAALW
jgi:ribonuclease H / adenosylcobalamin/alpha-ribazole phosphatase